MYCGKCGHEFEGGKFCPVCGCENDSGAAQNEGTSSNNFNTQYRPAANVSMYPMKWYKFLIYFAIWAGAVVNVYNAYSFFTGMIYGGEYEAQVVYYVFPSLKTLDMFSGIFCVAAIVLALVTWNGLRQYKAIGPKLVVAMYFITAAFNLIYIIAIYAILGEMANAADLGSAMGASIGAIVSGVIMGIANYVYFQKRSSLFVN